MGDVRKALGKGVEIDFEGRTWTMAPMKYKIQAKFEAWLERRAVEAVKRQKSYIGEDEYKEKMDKVDRNIAAGVYSFGGPVCVESARSIHGLKEIVRLCLYENHPTEVNHDFVDRLFEAKMEEAAKAVKQANADPTKPEKTKTESHTEEAEPSSSSTKSAPSSVTSPSVSDPGKSPS